MALDAYKEIMKPFQETDRIGKPEVTGYEDANNKEMLASDAGVLTYEAGMKRRKLKKVSKAQAAQETDLYIPNSTTHEELAAFFADGGFFRVETPDYSDVDPADWEDHNDTSPIDEDLGEDHDDYDELTFETRKQKPSEARRMQGPKKRLAKLIARTAVVEAELNKVTDLINNATTGNFYLAWTKRQAELRAELAALPGQIRHTEKVLQSIHGELALPKATNDTRVDFSQLKNDTVVEEVEFTFDPAWRDPEKDKQWAAELLRREMQNIQRGDTYQEEVFEDFDTNRTAQYFAAQADRPEWTDPRRGGNPGILNVNDPRNEEDLPLPEGFTEAEIAIWN